MSSNKDMPTFSQYLEEGYTDWLKTVVLGTLLGMSQACSVTPDSPECSIERSLYVNPWFDYQHQWLGPAKPKKDYPIALIGHIKSIIGEPPDPRNYEQTYEGRREWYSDLEVWYKRIKDEVDMRGWYKKYSM